LLQIFLANVVERKKERKEERKEGLHLARREKNIFRSPSFFLSWLASGKDDGEEGRKDGKNGFSIHFQFLGPAPKEERAFAAERGIGFFHQRDKCITRFRRSSHIKRQQCLNPFIISLLRRRPSRGIASLVFLLRLSLISPCSPLLCARL
jgi:hypothetical protein